MDKALRNSLRNSVTQCRRLLEKAIGEVLQGQFGIHPGGQVEEASSMGHLSDEDSAFREELVAHLRHIESLGFRAADAVAQMVRETAFTHLNRLCAYKMLERRKLIREAVSRGLKSNGFMRYLSYNPDDERLWSSGKQDLAYRRYLEWLAARRSDEIGVLFSPHDPANRLFPPQRVLDEVLALINSPEIDSVWDEDETIGWVYQYFTPKELRDQARKESAAPRNSYELAFRNQFFTPRYVVEFLVDNTLGRTWYEMRGGNTSLAESCRYMVRRPDEVFLSARTSREVEYVSQEVVAAVELLQTGDATTFPLFCADQDSIMRFIALALTTNGYDRVLGLAEGDKPQQALMALKERILSSPSIESFSTQQILDAMFIMQRSDYFQGGGELEEDGDYIRIGNELRRRVLDSRREDLSQEEMSRQPVFIPYRPKKDPRELRILDPACGSGHFLLYCFDLLLTIYEEAYDDSDLGPALKEQYPTIDDLRRAAPGLVLAHNLHGIDIDVRAAQIAALALWLRAQRAFADCGVPSDERPKITRSNIVCAEPMPGELEMLDEFTARLEPPLLGQLVRVVFDKMRLAGEAGSLLKIEEELSGAISAARKEWQREWQRATDRRGNPMLFTEAEMDRLSAGAPRQLNLFDVSGITDEQFWDELETRVLEALRLYAREAANGHAYQRTLFAEDAAQGFAFVDLCRKRYEGGYSVVLMNPPFGAPSAPSKQYVEKNYPRTKNDVYAAFVERGLELLHKGGMLGAITSRTGFFLSSFQKWREEIILKEARPTVVADLGMGVLDTAMVETAAYCLEVVR
jgi:hypothetical protein